MERLQTGDEAQGVEEWTIGRRDEWKHPGWRKAMDPPLEQAQLAGSYGDFEGNVRHFLLGSTNIGPCKTVTCFR